MFSSAKKRLIDQKISQEQQMLANTKEAKMRDQRGRMDPKAVEQYMLAYIQMKDMESSFYMQCMKQCVDLKSDWLSDKEQLCLTDCNRKIDKYVIIAKSQYNETMDDMKDTMNKMQKILPKK